MRSCKVVCLPFLFGFVCVSWGRRSTAPTHSLWTSRTRSHLRPFPSPLFHGSCVGFVWMTNLPGGWRFPSRVFVFLPLSTPPRFRFASCSLLSCMFLLLFRFQSLTAFVLFVLFFLSLSLSISISFSRRKRKTQAEQGPLTLPCTFWFSWLCFLFGFRTPSRVVFRLASFRRSSALIRRLVRFLTPHFFSLDCSEAGFGRLTAEVFSFLPPLSFLFPLLMFALVYSCG